MAGFQKTIILGNLVRDAESRMAGESEKCTYSVAVNSYRNKDDKSAEYFDCVQWKPGGVLPYLTQGTTVLCEGEWHTESWDGKDGQKKYKKILTVYRLQLVGGRKERAMEEEFAADFR